MPAFQSGTLPEANRDTLRTLLKLINSVKLLGYKIKYKKFVAFLYTNNELSEKLRKHIYNCIKKNKTPSKKINQGNERPVY